MYDYGLLRTTTVATQAPRNVATYARYSFGTINVLIRTTTTYAYALLRITTYYYVLLSTTTVATQTPRNVVAYARYSSGTFNLLQRTTYYYVLLRTTTYYYYCCYSSTTECGTLRSVFI